MAADDLYFVAETFFGDFCRLEVGPSERSFDRKHYQVLVKALDEVERDLIERDLGVGEKAFLDRMVEERISRGLLRVEERESNRMKLRSEYRWKRYFLLREIALDECLKLKKLSR